jgi:hypothetical protein
MKGVDHQGRLSDGVTNIVKKVGELLEQAVELLQGIHGALVCVVEEETLERCLDRVCHQLAEEHHLHDLWGIESCRAKTQCLD